MGRVFGPTGAAAVTRRQHSAQGHAAAGRYYAERGAQPVTRDCRVPTNDERLARYYAHPVAIKRRPLPNLDWRKRA